MRSSTPVLIICLLTLTAGGARAVDGLVEINDVRAQVGGVTPGDTAGFPVTIDRPGSYILTGNLYSTGANETIIQITASDVTLDLNGFTIRCTYIFNPCAGTGSGKGIDGSGATNLTVRNGTVRDMPSRGLELGSYSKVENVRALANGGDGIYVGTSSHVRASRANDNAESGIYVGSGSIVESSVSASNVTGILASRGALIRDNTIKNNSGVAIDGVIGPLYAGYVGNVITSNNGTSESVDGNQGIAATPIGTNLCGTDTTCP